MALFDSADMPVDEVDRKPGGLVCLGCGCQPKIMCNLDGLYYCEECAEGVLRKRRFEEEEKDWNNPSLKPKEDE